MPAHLASRVGALLQVAKRWNIEPRDYGSMVDFDRELAVVDPCAADGAAVFAVVEAMLCGADATPVRYYLAEMEATRFSGLTARWHGLAKQSHETSKIRHGDAFRIQIGRDEKHRGASLVFLNPPYDVDKRYQRTEARWLARFTDALCERGVLAFVLPYYALAACADMLSTQYIGLRCYRFPDADFDVYRQVVLFAYRRGDALLAPDPDVHAQVMAWSVSVDDMPELAANLAPVMNVPSLNQEDGGCGLTWILEPLDVDAIVADWKPWRSSTRDGGLKLIPGVLPEDGVRGMHAQTFTVAMPLGFGHVPPAIACNVFDGITIEPDDAATGLPPILLAARFRRDWCATNDRLNAKGEKVAEDQEQQPSLVMTALDMRRGTYHRMANSTERKSSTNLAKMTMADPRG